MITRKLRKLAKEFEKRLMFEKALSNNVSLPELFNNFDERFFKIYAEIDFLSEKIEDVHIEGTVFFKYEGQNLSLSKDAQVCENLIKDLVNSQKKFLEKGKVSVLKGADSEDRKFDVLLIFGDNEVFGILKESLSNEVMVQVAELITSAQELEKKRLSLDLHDSVAQHLSGVKFLLDALRRELNGSHSALIEKCDNAVDLALDETRIISRNLMPVKIENEGIDSILMSFVERLNSHFNVNCNIEINTKISRFSKNFQLAFYRVVQELCSNSIKHGKAKNLNLIVNQDKDSLSIQYKDDGLGFELDNIKGSGMGLSNIFYRVNQFKGKLELDSAINKGVIFSFRIPLEEIVKL